MPDALFVFKRKEKKYLLSEKDYNAFISRAQEYLVKDSYGEYTICNIYYDTQDYSLIRRSIEKPQYKEKLRLRSYGVPSYEDKVFLEIKKKYKGIVYKRRSALSLREAEAYMNEGILPSQENQIFREIEYFVSFYRPQAKIFLAYDRTAFAGAEDSGLRITFDRNIRSREYDLSLSAGDYGECLLEKGQCLMEIKGGGGMPVGLARILSDMQIFPVSFSKYGNVYKNMLRSEAAELRAQ